MWIRNNNIKVLNGGRTGALIWSDGSKVSKNV